MPTLNWIGKKAVINHDRDVPFHLLQEVPELSFGDKDSGNLIVQGDNLIALKSLLPYYAGRVQCIYIDPPYNTGNEEWVYNDNVNDPVIRSWINQVVGKESEDLSRHDKWLCMMYPRLKLLREFLRQDGTIWVSLDYHEQPYLRMLLDEIFGSKNLISEIACVNKPSGRSDDKFIATAHESIIVYKREGVPVFGGFQPEDKITRRYSKTDTDGRRYREEDLRKRGTHDERTDRPNLFYPFFFNQQTSEFLVGKNEMNTPDGFTRIEPMKTKKVQGTWRWERDTAIKQIAYLHPRYMPKKRQWSVFEWEFLDERGLVKSTTVWGFKDVNSERGTEAFLDLGFSKNDFPNPKPVGTILRVLQLASKPGDIVLDSFAGSGTTGHAVLKQNAADQGHRKFIMVEMQPDIAETITSERIRRVSKGYITPKGKEVSGLGGGGFRYYRLGNPLFDEYGNVFGEVSFSDLAKHVFFSETGVPLPDGTELNTPFIGAYEGRAIYLLYNGILKDRNPRSGNVLTREVLSYLPEFDGPKVVYGTGCRLSAMTLRAAQIEFKQIPYELKR